MALLARTPTLIMRPKANEMSWGTLTCATNRCLQPPGALGEECSHPLHLQQRMTTLRDNVSLATLREALGELTSTRTGTEMAPPGCNVFTP